MQHKTKFPIINSKLLFQHSNFVCKPFLNCLKRQPPLPCENINFIIFLFILHHKYQNKSYYCAPCERRLNNAIQFKKVKTETRKALAENARTKRCVDISPTVERPTKVRTAGTGSSRPTRH